MWCCPKCKGPVRISEVRTTVIAYPDGTEIDGGIEWDEGNEAECVSCNWTGTAGEIDGADS